MRSVSNNPHRTYISISRISARSLLQVLTGCLIVAIVPIALYVRVKSENTRLVVPNSKKQEVVTVHAAGRAMPFFNLQDGHQIFATFSGAGARALQSGQAQARALASGDLDGNATPDVVAGYNYGGTGIVTIQRGNPDAFAPQDTSVYERMQNGYNPDALLPQVETFTTPAPADSLQIGDFNGDNRTDILVGAHGGGLFLLANDGNGSFLAAQQIQLPGSITALTAGEFRAADGKLDVGVGVNGPGGPELLVYDGAKGGLTGTPMEFPLTSEASVIRFEGMDDDPFVDAVVAAGSDVVIVHGWGRKESPALNSRLERVSTPSEIRGLTVGNFSWNREGRPDIAALAADGTLRLFQGKGLNTAPFTEAELSARRARGRVQAPKSEQERFIDVETTPSWNGAGRKTGWTISQTVATNATPKNGNPNSALTKTNLLSRETEEIIATSSNELKILRRGGNASEFKNSGMAAATVDASSDMAQISLPSETSPVAVLELPQKLNGERDLITLQDGSANLSIVPNAPNTTITVDRTDDPSGGSLAAASACTVAGSDCSLRGAIQFANNPANNNTTINIPAGTYTLAINGAGGCVTEAAGNTVGDLEINQTTTIVGAGSASTIIRQHGTGAANAGDRVMCLNVGFALNLNYSFTGITIMGGRESNGIGGAGIIGGEKGNTLTLTDVTITNNQVINGNLGGGGISMTGGNVTITNSLIGGTSAPQATFDPSILANRDTVANANKNNTSSGAGLYFTPSAPTHSASTGNLVVTGTTLNHNVAGNGGGGGELEIFNVGAGLGTGSATFDTSTFTNNQATNGAGLQVASLPTTLGSIAGTLSFTSNAASAFGGGVHQSGSTLTINGTTATINFASNNTAPTGSSVSINGNAFLSGTQTTIGGDFAVLTNGAFTANAGSSMSPQNFRILGGTATLTTPTTINVTGDFQIGREATRAGILNANGATVNIQGNLNVDLSPNGPAAAGQFNAGTSTFNFNGTGAQSANNAGPGTPITFFNFTDSNITQPLTINNSINVSNTLNVNGANAILNPAAAVVIAGTGTLTGTGTARATRTAATADFLNQYTITNKTLTTLTIDYNGAGNQTVNNTPSYSNLVISGTNTKTLQGNTVITGNLNIAAATLATNNFNFALGGNWTNAATFTPGTGTVTFQGTSGTQTLTGTTTFFNLTLNNTGATTDFGATSTTIGNDLVASAGTMAGGTSTIIFTGVGDNLGSISGAQAKNFHNLQINSPATISNTTGGAINILNDYTNTGTFTQDPGLSTNFVSGPDGIHAMSGAGTNTFGLFSISTANTVNASSNFNVVGASFTVAGTGAFNGSAGTATFNGGVAQQIAGDGTKNFSGLLINNVTVNGVTVVNGTGAVDAFVGGLLTLNTNLTVAPGAILQQGGTSAGAFDVLGTVRRTDLGVTERPFGHAGNTITINSGTPPTQLDFNLVKAAPGTFPAGVKVVPRDITLTPVGGAGISATVKMRYIDPTELTPSTITESRLVLWKNVGGTTWTPQGGTPDTANNFVSLSGVSSFSEWAIAEASDLTLSKANNVSGSAVVGQAWNWTLTAANTGSPATFTAGQTILSDDLPNSNVIYGTPTVQNASNITGSANILCSITSNTLTCVANGGSVTFASNIGASSFDVVFSATAQAAGSYQNPRTGGGVAKVDPNLVIVESNENNNTPTNNTVTVGKANTTTTINSDLPDPSVVGQPVTVTWSVTVNAPGSLGAPLTGNVTVSDGTNQCVAAVSAGQCDVTFTSAGAKSLTATYAGDTNYNGSASTPATAHTVNKADTTTTITSDNPDPSTPGQSVTVQWTTTVNAPGAGTPTGNVTVTVSGGAETCSAPVATGQCSLVLNGTGTRTITATYAGDTNFNTSSDTESHQVCGNTLVTTATNSGAGSLRQIITDACDGAVITFDAAAFATPQTIPLASEIAITKNLTIKASSTQKITLSGSGTNRVFNISSGSSLNVVGLTFSSGSAINGGAILNDGTLTIVNSTLSNNTATTTDGGAINNTATGSLTLINTTISGNTAVGNGGGVNVVGGTVTSINCTITNNTADLGNGGTGTGGGIKVQAGTVTLKNTIVSGNFNDDGVSDAADDVSGTINPSSSSNLIGGTASLGPLADNGGTTQTHALLQGSAAIEAGDNANLPADTFDLDGDANVAETLPVDQRGTNFPRVADSADPDPIQTVDIGAYEAHPTVEDITDKTTTEETALPQFTFNIGDGTGSLITSVTATSSNLTLIPNANVVVSGTGTSRKLDINPAANANSPADGTSTITVTVTATNGRTATDTFVVTVTEVNDAPVPSNDIIADIAEDCASGCTAGKYVIPFATLLANDTNKGAPNESGQTLNITAVSLPTGGTVQINGTNVEFTPTANYFGPAGFTYTVTDNGTTNNVLDAKTGNATVSFNVTAVNDPPSFTIAANPPAVPQDAGPQTVLNFATNISAGPNETGQTLTFNVTPNGTTGTLTFSTAPAIDPTTGTLTYTATNGTNGTATFSVTLSDNGSNTPPNSNTSGAQSFTITVTPPNATPVVTTTAGNLTYIENAGAVAIDPGLTVTDSDSTDLTGATITITAGFSSAQDTLAFTAQFGITGNYDSGTGVLTLSGTTSVANYQTVLRSVTYANSSDNPTASRTIQFSVTDGFTIGSATRGIDISAVNDAPVNTVPGPQTTIEDTPKVFSISVADPDLGANAIKITLVATNGKVSLSTTAGLSITTGTGTNDTTVVFTGTLANVNAALTNLTFTPTPDFNGAASLQITSDDQGFTGTGGAKTDIDTISITVTPANDAPVVTATAGNLSYTENDAPTAIDPGLTVTDDSTNLTGATVAITGNFATGQDVLGFVNQLGITGSYDSVNGILTLTGTTSIANYQTALRTVTYQNTSNDPSTALRTVTFTANDGTLTGSATRGIAVTAVNDPPVNTVPGGQSTPQNTPLTFPGNISVADPDAGANNIQVTLSVTNGTLTLSGTSGLSFSFTDANGTGAGDGTADTTMTFRGTLANVNAALNGMTFTPTLGFTGSAVLTITSNDLGNSGTGGPLSDTDTVSIQVGVTNVSIQATSSVTEPDSGSVNMVFTVTLSAPAPAGGVSVSFTTQDQAPSLTSATAGQDYTATSGTLNFAMGEQIKTISVPVLSDNKKNEQNETFLVLLSNPVNATITNGTSTGTILVANQPGTILITELRTSGPGGAGDDFVEIYNNSDTPHTVNSPTGTGYGLYKMGADCNASPVLIGFIPNGTVIPARGHYLFTGSAYSLANYGGSGAAAGDQALSQDIENDRNVAIFNTTSLVNLSTATRFDAVGFDANTSGVCDLLREGTNLPAMSGNNSEYSFFRDECGKKGNPATFGPCPTGGFVMDSNNNNNDFIFANTTGTVTPAGQRLGAPGPQNSGAPRLNLSVAALLLDASKSSTSSPNRERDNTPVPNGAQGTMTIRRRFVNNTGAPVTHLRFRVVDISSMPTSNPIADLRVLDSTTVTVTGIKDSATCAATGTPSTQPCTVTVFGTTLEQPPTQLIGGALNSSLKVGNTLTLTTPLGPGQSINLQFLLGVQNQGSFKFFFNIEALP